MTTSKKIVSMALTATTALWASGALLLVPVASAQSTSDLQSQIAALLAQIQQLQSQLNAASGTTTASYGYTRDLTVGSKGDDVSALQQMLINGGHLTAVSAPTGYFGSLTKAAVAKWQAAVGLSPAAGYFGPKSRAYVASLSVGTTPGTTPVYVPAPASGLAVKLDATNPVAGSLISSASTAAARVPVLTVDYTAGNSGAVTINEIKFTKTGVISDSSISGAYLVENGKVLAQYNSISSGIIDFAGLSLSVPAGQTRVLTLAIDPSTGLTAGNTVGFSLAAAANVSATDASGNAITASGMFPFVGSTFTVTTVSNPSIASLTVASTSIATSITAGTTNNIVGAWNFSVSNSKVWLKGLNFKVIGSANKTDIRNLKLYVNGAQVGSTLASVAADGTAYFDATATPGTLNTGSNNIQVFADVMGSPSYNFQLEILNSYDIYAVDSQYNVPIAGESDTGTQVSITTGSITVSQSGDTPTGNLAKGQSGVTLAKFAFYAGGESVKVKYLDYTLTFTGTATSTLSNWVKNIALIDDAGGQLGTTDTTPHSASTSCAVATAAFTGSVYNSCFGTSASPINYIIPANTTRVLSLKADVQSTADFSSVVGALTGNTSNLQGLTSSAAASSGSANGASLSLASTQLTVAKNTAVGTQVMTKPVTAAKIGSYALTASSADGVTISTLTFQVTGNGGFDLQNLKVMVGGTQFGTTQATVSASGTYSFAGSPFTVPKGGTLYVEVYGDVLSSSDAGTYNNVTTMTGLSGTGLISYNSVSLASSVAGQGVTLAGQSGITITADSAMPAAGHLVMGSTGNTLAAFRFTESTNYENIKITDMNVFDAVASGSVACTDIKSGFGNVSLFNGATLVGTAGSAAASIETSTPATPGCGYIYTFHFGTPLVIPQSNSVTLTLKGDVSSYSSSGATDNTTHIFKIATTTDTTNDTAIETIVALGQSSNATSTVTLTSANGNAQTLLRTKLTVSATPMGGTSARAKGNPDDLASLNFAADSAGALKLGSVTVTFAGNGPSTGGGFYTGGSAYNTCTGCMVQLYDAANGTAYYAVTSSSPANSLTFDFNNYIVSAGTSKSFTLRVNSLTGLAVAGSGVAVTLGASISGATSTTWVDGLDTAASKGLNVPASTIPVNIQSVSYAQGT